MEPGSLFIRLPKRCEARRIVRLLGLIGGTPLENHMLGVAKNDGAHWAIIIFLSRARRDLILKIHEQKPFPVQEMKVGNRPCDKVTDEVADALAHGASLRLVIYIPASSTGRQAVLRQYSDAQRPTIPRAQRPARVAPAPLSFRSRPTAVEDRPAEHADELRQHLPARSPN